MFHDHPTFDDFQGLWRRAIRSDRVPATRHLLAACPSCRDVLRDAGWGSGRLDRLLRLLPADMRHAEEAEPLSTEHDYGRAFAGAEQAVGAYFAQDAPLEVSSETLLTELLGLPEEEQKRAATEHPRFAHPLVVHALIEKSHQVRFDDPRMMVHLADLGRLVAGACTEQAAGNAERLADLRARSLMQHGNALRVCGELHEADQALTEAQRFRRAGTHDPLLRARLLEHLASLRTFQGRFQEGIELAHSAGKVYRELGEDHQLASTMVQKAIASLYAGETETAIQTLNRAIPLIEPEESPQLLLAACHNLIRGYIDLGQPDQALSIYFEVRDLYRELNADTTIRLRAGWQEGQLLRDLGYLQAAEAVLAETRKGFLDRDIAYEVALVSLDLASVYVREGKVEEVKRTVAETVPIFQALRVGRETLASLLQLQQAAGQEQQALDLIHTLNMRLAPLSHTTQ